MKTQYFNADRERVTGAQCVITSDHANIHEGEGFNAWVYAEGAVDDAYVQLEFKTPLTGRYIHMKSMVAMSEGLGSFEVIESPTLTTGSTAFVPTQLNRNNSTASTVIIKSNPTTISGGTVLRAYLIGAGKENGGPANNDTEIVLKPDTTYLFRVRNLAGAAKALSLYLFWYEENGK